MTDLSSPARAPRRRLRRLLLSALLLAVAAGTASADLFQPGTQPRGEPGGLMQLVQPAFGCGECHSGYDDSDDYEPYDSWRGSMMASAGRDPVFLAALAIAEQDHPDAAGYCLRCHSPPAWLRGRGELPEWSEADGARLREDGPGGLSTDRDGIVCMVCHRAIEDVPSDPEAPYLQNAQLYLADGVDAETMRGPYSYMPGETAPMHRTEVSEFLPRGDFCGQCHDIVNPLVEGHRADGTPTGRPMAIERTYTEWASSAFAERGQTCQDCHMPDVEEDVRAARDGSPRAHMRRHTLVGASTWQPRALASLSEFATDAERAAWMRTAERAEQMLASAAEVEMIDVTVDGDVVRATVRVTNLTGHKLPTGYGEGRRMWLEVANLDAAGDPVAGSGLYDLAERRLVDDPQLRSYEMVLGEGSTPSFHFALDDTILADTRIPPEGFDPPDDRDVEPVGRDYGDGAGGYRHFDEATFELPACGERVRARLRYQSTTREYIEFLRDTAPDSLEPGVGNYGQIAYQAWLDHGGGVPVDMAAASAALEGLPPCEVEAPDAGAPGDDGGTAVDAGEVADAGREPGGGGGGCGCAAAPGGTGGALALALAALLVARPRRRGRA